MNTRAARLAAALLACSSLWATGASRVWVFHDEDPNYQSPPFDDVLMTLEPSGQVGLARGGFNIAQTVGGNRVIAATDHGDSVLVCEFVADRLWKLAADGSPLFSIARPITAVDVTATGSIFALEDHTGTIFGENILHISPEGQVLNQAARGGFDLVVNEASRTIVIVGADIKCLDFDLNLLWTLDPIAWCAVSVDRASDGAVWVAEREHPQVGGSANRLLQISPIGTVLRTIDLAYSPFCVRVDRIDDSVYVAGDKLYKYDRQGTLIQVASLGTTVGTSIVGWSLAIDELGQVWVGTWSDVRKFSPSGALLLSTNLFSRPSNTYVAIHQVTDEHLAIFMPRTVSEGDGPRTGMGQVRLSGPLSTNLVVSLAGSANHRLAVPSNVTISAGQLAGNFDLVPLDNANQDGDQTVTVTATAPGYPNASASILVTDDEIAPIIVSQPMPQTIVLHGTAQFRVSATGQLPLSYQWVHEGRAIPGATNASHLIVNGETNDAGSYSVLVSNLYGGVGSSNAALSVRGVEHFTEWFTANDNDLAFSSVTFSPDGSASGYAACRQAATMFPTDPTGGIPLPLHDDEYVSITLTGTNTVALFGRRTQVLFVGANGYLTMDAGDQEYRPTPARHFERPRIAALFEDLLPARGGTVSWRQLSDRVAVTYQNVPHYNQTAGNSFQIEMFFDGRIRVTYLALALRYGLAGLSAGKGLPLGFQESDLSSYGPCGVLPIRITFASAGHGTMRLYGEGIPGVTYQWQRAPSIAGPWTTLGSETATAGLIEWHDTNTLDRAFYRVVPP